MERNGYTMNKNVNYYKEYNDKKYSDFADLLYQSARDFPSKDCYRFIRDKNEYKISFSRFVKTVYALGQALEKLGHNKGHTAIIGEKCFEWLTSYFAAIIFGGVAVPLDKELAHDQIRNFVNFADCDTVVYTKKYADVFVDHESEMPGVKLFIEITLDAPVNINSDENDATIPDGNHTTFDNLVTWGHSDILKNGVSAVVKNQDAEKMSIIIFTSGTTGTSKGVMLSQKNVLSCLCNALKLIDVSSDDVLVSVLPFHHTYEMTAGILAAYAVGATVCINDNIRNTTHDFKYFKPTILALVPLFVTTIYKKIMDTARKKGLDKTLQRLMKTDRVLRRVGIDLRKAFFSQVTSELGGRLTRIICGGAPMPPDMTEKFASFGISVSEGFGITECSPVIAVAPFEYTRRGSCGLLLSNMQLYIDRDDVNDETGEIVVKGDNVMLGYYKNETATADVLSDRGWFRTGDCGYIDSDNYLFITGRKKNVIVLNNGKNVFPEEIEEYLGEIELIKECTVVGRKSEKDGAINVTAIIFPDFERAKEKNITADEDINIYFRNEITKLNKRIASFKQIKGIEIRKAPFPKTTTQKIQRHKIDNE